MTEDEILREAERIQTERLEANTFRHDDGSRIKITYCNQIIEFICDRHGSQYNFVLLNLPHKEAKRLAHRILELIGENEND